MFMEEKIFLHDFFENMLKIYLSYVYCKKCIKELFHIIEGV